MPSTPLVFDGHNDTLTRLLRQGGVPAARDFLTGLPGHIDIPKAKAGGFAGGFFAIWIAPKDKDGLDHDAEMSKAEYDLPLPGMLDQSYALTQVHREAAILFELERLGALRICRSVADIRAAMAADQMAAIFHIEGAEAIGPDLDALEVLYQAGLRSLGPVWSRPTIFAEGVPFRFPSSPDTGGGLTEAGKALVKRCNERRIMVDLSHITEAGFWDVAKLSDAPLVASHSCAHALCPHSRNLTDDQLRAIADSDGLVGLNYAVAFLREDGRMISDVPLDRMMQHLDHLIQFLGEDGVALGSDFDGATCPDDLNGAQDLPNLRQAMAGHGYSDELITKICHENWLRVLEKTWGA